LRIAITINAAALQADLDARPEQIKQAIKRTTLKGLQYAQKEAVKDLALAHGIAQKVLKARRRIAVRTDQNKIWIGILPIAAIHLGKSRQTRQGVSVGSRRYPGAFLTTMASGHKGVFERVGRKRLPIREIAEPLDQAVAVIDGVRTKLASRLPVLLQQELNYEVNVRG
jgi:hypothetical protein